MGGLVYNSWRGFATVKAKHAPAQPRSIKQLAVRAVAVFCSRAWGTLTNQADWNAYAVTHTLVDWTNSPKRLTGANWFVALSTRLLRLGIPEVDTPPTTPAPDAVTGITATGSAGAILVDWTTPSDHTNSVELWLDGPHTAGRQGSLIKSLYNCAPWGDEGGLSISGLQAGTYDVYARVLDRSNGLVSPFVGAVATVS
jgi:hypothetical protein